MQSQATLGYNCGVIGRIVDSQVRVGFSGPRENECGSESVWELNMEARRSSGKTNSIGLGSEKVGKMKKLIALAAVATCGAALAVESANIVGYSGKTTGSDNNFVTIPFNAIGYNTSDIQQIKISDDGAGGIGWGAETFDIWEGLPTAVEGAGFVYFDPGADPAGEATDYYWGDAEGNKATFSIAPNQGVVINCAEGLTITIEPPYTLGE